MTLLALLQQVPLPTDSTGVGAYMWISGLLAGALVTVSIKLFNVLVKDRDEWKAHAKELATALSLTTETLRTATDAIEASRAEGHELGKAMREGIVRLEARIEDLVKRAS